MYGYGAAGVAGIENLTHANYVWGGAQGGSRCPGESLAYTDVGSLTVYLCQYFFNGTGGWQATADNQALTLIHESLHSNGLYGHAGLSSPDFQKYNVDPPCR